MPKSLTALVTLPELWSWAAVMVGIGKSQGIWTVEIVQRPAVLTLVTASQVMLSEDLLSAPMEQVGMF